MAVSEVPVEKRTSSFREGQSRGNLDCLRLIWRSLLEGDKGVSSDNCDNNLHESIFDIKEIDLRTQDKLI